MESYFDNGLNSRKRKQWSWILGGGSMLWAVIVLGSLFAAIDRIKALPNDGSTDVVFGPLTLLHMQKQPAEEGYLLGFQLAIGLLISFILSFVVITGLVFLISKLHSDKKTTAA